MTSFLLTALVGGASALITGSFGFYYLTHRQYPDQNVVKRAFGAVAISGFVLCLISGALGLWIFRSPALGLNAVSGWGADFAAIGVLSGTRYARL